MEKLFVTFNLAIKLKEKGFNDKCFAYQNPESHEFRLHGYSTYCDGKEILNIPTHQQCVDWLRVNHSIFAFVKTEIIHGSEIHTGMILGKTEPIEVFCDSEDYYDTYKKMIEEALKLI